MPKKGRKKVFTKVVKKKIAEVQGELGVAIATDVEPAKKWCVWLHALHMPLSTRLTVLPD